MKAVAVDIGGTHAACALVQDDRILAFDRLPVGDGALFSSLLPAMADSLDRLLEGCGFSAAACAGLAISFPGIVDPFSGRIFSTPKGKYDNASSLDLRAWCRQRFGLPFRIENDAKMALLGERYAGAARGFDDIVTITLGTGVGVGAMMHGRLLRGAHFQACLGGHLPAVFNGRPCRCGNIGCVEAEASTWALPEICRSWPGFDRSALAREARLDFAALFRQSAAGDTVATQVRDRCLHVWAAGIVGLVHAYDPDVAVLGGSVMKSANQILPFLESYVHAHAWSPCAKVRLRAAQLGDKAALLGALPLLNETC